MPFQVTTFDEAIVTVLDKSLQRSGPLAVRFANAWVTVMADKDARYLDLLASSGLNYPDGRPIAWVLQRRFGASAHQVRGPAFFEAALDVGRARGVRHFLLGGTPESLAGLVAAVEDRYPGVAIAGSHAPPFGPVEQILSDAALEAIRVADPHIVWVGIGSPKQDWVAQKLSDTLSVTAIGVGAAFDFSSGTVREAPRWVRRFALEWLFRLASDPRRLWRRYIVGNVQFVRLAIRHRRQR